MRPPSWALGGGALVAAALSGSVRPATSFAGRSSGPWSAPTPLPDHLPRVLREHLDVDGDGLVPHMDTVELWGRGRMRVASGVWLPLRMRTLHQLGHAFVPDIELSWHGRTVVSATEAFVDGQGWSQQRRTSPSARRSIREPDSSCPVVRSGASLDVSSPPWRGVLGLVVGPGGRL
jgi:hypothetical protein